MLVFTRNETADQPVLANFLFLLASWSRSCSFWWCSLWISAVPLRQWAHLWPSCTADSPAGSAGCWLLSPVWSDSLPDWFTFHRYVHWNLHCSADQLTFFPFTRRAIYLFYTSRITRVADLSFCWSGPFTWPPYSVSTVRSRGLTSVVS